MNRRMQGSNQECIFTMIVTETTSVFSYSYPVKYGTYSIPDSKVDGANTETTWFLSAPGGPLVGPMNIGIRVMWAAPLHMANIPNEISYVCEIAHSRIFLT